MSKLALILIAVVLSGCAGNRLAHDGTVSEPFAYGIDRAYDGEGRLQRLRIVYDLIYTNRNQMRAYADQECGGAATVTQDWKDTYGGWYGVEFTCLPSDHG